MSSSAPLQGGPTQTSASDQMRQVVQERRAANHRYTGTCILTALRSVLAAPGNHKWETQRRSNSQSARFSRGRRTFLCKWSCRGRAKSCRFLWFVADFNRRDGFFEYRFIDFDEVTGLWKAPVLHVFGVFFEGRDSLILQTLVFLAKIPVSLG